ncbi:MAG: TauD/TfdA family dioxygenase [Acidimicrobiales bacterium]
MTVMSEIIIEPLPATLGATVRGVRLATLDDATWQVVEDAFHTYGLLIFPDQHLSDDEQMAFGRRFGQLEQGLTLAPLSNITAEGDVRPADGVVMQMLRGNEGWHTDSSYMPLAAKASMLSAHVVPSSGGETEWADMRAAYDALDDATRAHIESLSAFHSIRYSQKQLGFADVVNSYGYDVEDPPLRPLVKVHPVTGRPALYIGRHAHAIPGLSADESQRLLAELLQDACQTPRTYRHHWAPGDLAVWDNRCVLHHACGYDYREPRVMKHTRVSGEATEVAPHCGYATTT